MKLYEMICPSRNIENEEHTEGCFRLVELCEHGAVERHPVYADDAVEGDEGHEWSIFERWCEGAALKEGT